MTASTETGVEGVDNEFKGVPTEQPTLDTTPDETGNTNGSGPMRPMDGYPVPHKEEPPQQPKPQQG